MEEEEEEEVEEGEEEEEEEIEYIRGVAARKVKRLSADDKTASRRPAASKGARGLSLARSSSTNLRRGFAVFRRSRTPPEISRDATTRARSARSKSVTRPRPRSVSGLPYSGKLLL